MKFAIAALLGLMNVQAITEDKTIALDVNLKCGHCIRGTHNFCVDGKEGAVVKSDGSGAPTTKCVKDAAAGTALGGTWKCSASYSDKDLAMTMCPQKQAKCGSKQEVDFTTEGQTDNLEVKDLKKGESCTFKIKAKCGAPGFKMKDTSGGAASKFDISYVEYNSEEVTKDASTGRPKPSQKMTNQGKQTKGQKRPPRKDSEGNTISSKELGKPDTDRKPPPAFSDPSKTKDTYSSGGFGEPSSGTYDPSVKGYKTFGTLGQGDKAQGAKDSAKGACSEREQYVTVTAKEDTSAADTVLLEVGAYAFDTAKAVMIKALAASALAVFSVSQF